MTAVQNKPSAQEAIAKALQWRCTSLGFAATIDKARFVYSSEELAEVSVKIPRVLQRACRPAHVTRPQPYDGNLLRETLALWKRQYVAIKPSWVARPYLGLMLKPYIGEIVELTLPNSVDHSTQVWALAWVASVGTTPEKDRFIEARKIRTLHIAAKGMDRLLPGWRERLAAARAMGLDDAQTSAFVNCKDPAEMRSTLPALPQMPLA